MGIPRLAGHLQPYSGTITLRDNHQLIIDGPGLAYHIYFHLLRHRSETFKGIDAVPSYNEIGNAFIAYLELLEACRCHISHIYFDGSLPIHKRPTRLSRLEASLRDLIRVHDQYPGGFPSSRNASLPAIQAVQLFQSPPPLSPLLRSLPAPPFLIPACSDAISHSRYHDITVVVSNEADTYCALAARNTGGMILTSDSDLLVYDTGPDASVAFLSQLSLKTADELPGTADVLQANVFRPAEIAKRLHLAKLARLAYEVKFDPTVSFAEALRRSKSASKDPSLLNDFLDEYALPSPRSTPADPFHPDSNPQLLDPRLSELIHQLSSPSGHPTIHYYLPFLIDDPSRSSAWDVSFAIRHATYALLASKLLPPRVDRTVEEIGRRGYRMLSIAVPWNTNHAEELKDLIALLAKSRTRFLALPLVLQHRIFALAYIQQWHVTNDKNPPERALLIEALTPASSGSKVVSWASMHLEAQIQSVLYALRMLKQSTAHLADIGKRSGEGDGVAGEMMGALNDLPGVRDLCLSSRELRELIVGVDVDVADVLDIVIYPPSTTVEREESQTRIVGAEEQDLDTEQTNKSEWQIPKKKRKKQAPRTQRTKKSEPKACQSNTRNLYSLLHS